VLELLKPLLFIVAATFAWWLVITLDAFSIRRPVLGWIYGVLTAEWGVGAVNLSLGRILAFGPTVYAVRWKENIYLGMVVHCTGNTLGIILVGNLVLGRI